jgi:hypothetical protein
MDSAAAPHRRPVCCHPYPPTCSFLRDCDGKVTPEEVAAAANYLKDTIGAEGVQELISNLSKDNGAYIQHPCLSY